MTTPKQNNASIRWKLILQYWPLYLVIATQLYTALQWKFSIDRKFDDAARDREHIISAINSHVNDDVHMPLQTKLNTFETIAQHEKDVEAIKASMLARQIAVDTAIATGFARIEGILAEERKVAEQRFNILNGRIIDAARNPNNQPK